MQQAIWERNVRALDELLRWLNANGNNVQRLIDAINRNMQGPPGGG